MSGIAGQGCPRIVPEEEKKTLEEIERSLVKKYRKPIWSKFIKAIKEYKLVEEGDKIAVAISGGKDSLLMAKMFQELQKHGQVKFDLVFLAMDPGYHKNIRQLLEENCEYLNIPLTIFDTNIFDVAGEIAEDYPCYMCARMRRGALYNKAEELGCNKLALGHHFDDAVQTFFMNLFYGGKIGCFSPMSYLSRKDLYLIRPMVFCEESKVESAAQRYHLPVVKSECPVDGHTCRQSTQELIKDLEKQFPDLRRKVMGALQRADIDGWGKHK